MVARQAHNLKVGGSIPSSATNSGRIPKLRDVAQSGSATVWGTGGRKFKSCHPDYKKEWELFFLFCLPIFSTEVLISA